MKTFLPAVKVTQEVATRVIKILDSSYCCSRADLKEVIAKVKQLMKVQLRQLLKLLEKYEDIFDDTQGQWGTNQSMLGSTQSLVE